MMAQAGGYYSVPFKGYQVVTQVSPISPTLFNVMVDEVVQHGILIVEEDKPEGFGW